MQVFKKTVVAAVLAVSSVSVFSAVTPDGKRFYVDNIIPNFQAVQDNLLQWKTGYNNSCGPTSLLFVSNHYVRNATGQNSPNMSSVAASQKTLKEVVYPGMGLAPNSYTSLDQLSSFAKNKLGWTNVRRMADANGTTANINNLLASLQGNHPALVVLNKNYSGYPLPGTRVDHIVVLFAYNKQTDEYGRAWNHAQNTRNMDLIEYYEPYYGYMRTVPRKDVYLGTTSRAFNVSNFSYLQVGR